MRQSSMRASHNNSTASAKKGQPPVGASPSISKVSNFDAASSFGGTPGKRAQSKKIGGVVDFR